MTNKNVIDKILLINNEICRGFVSDNMIRIIQNLFVNFDVGASLDSPKVGRDQPLQNFEGGKRYAISNNKRNV